MNNSQNSSLETAIVLCRACGSPIHHNNEDAFLESFRELVQLRCVNPQCGHTGWYDETDFERDTTPAIIEAEGVGEVWVHDLLLGLSFRAHNDTP